MGEFTLPDDAKVVVIDGLNQRTYMTLGDACNRWKDSRYWGINDRLLRGETFRSLGLRITLLSFKHDGWTISYDPPPIPARNCDWSFTHEDYDASWEGEEDGYVDNGLGGTAASPAECLEQITEIEAEHSHFQMARENNGQFGVGA